MNKRLSTRDYILLLLKTNGQMGTKEIQNRLGLTKVAVSRQMIHLEKDGFVQYTLGRHQLGRPMHYYSLTPLGQEQFPSDYGQLAVELLDHMAVEEAVEEGEDRLDAFFKRQQARFIEKYADRMRGKNLAERVEELAGIQDVHGFMTKWEQQDEGAFAMIQHNCPYFKIANRYEAICERELSSYQALLEAAVERPECVAKGAGRCVYLIREREQRIISDSAM
ncbi:helix-turn-helix transcriptional regulator [Brevibacillus reuszeri]|uniref:helix-turn-helix transcriptional regulator n=1 Tax=Brevibacillus reuszeri TaxID=54915 RepID=UPI003D252C7E